MATVGATNLTLGDWTKRNDPDGKSAKIVEILNDTNEILDDMVWMEGNLPTGHQTTIRTGLPQAYWRMLNQGVPNAKSRTKQITDACGMLQVYSEVDEDLASLNGNSSDFLLNESRPFIEGMTQQMATSVIYGNTETDPERIMGFGPRYDDKTAENAENLVDGGGVSGQTDCTSIWLVCWGMDSVFGMFPKGSKAGLEQEYKGVVTVDDADGNQFEAHRTLFKWKTGLTVRDWRYIVRIHSVDISTLLKTAASGSDLVDLMTQAVEIPPMLKGKCAFYCNKTIRSMLRRQIVNKSNVHLSLDEVAGKQVMTFDGIPVRRTDAIVNTETSLN